jgi:phosphatidylinositol glycan class A protein
MSLGPFVGPIYTIILIVDCLFFAFLEWWMPRENIDYVDVRWDATRFEKVRPFHFTCYSKDFDV